MKERACPFQVGDYVRFTPSSRTLGLYQDIERLGVKVGGEMEIKEVRDDIYLFFESEKGGWPWNEFTLVKKT